MRYRRQLIPAALSAALFLTVPLRAADEDSLLGGGMMDVVEKGGIVMVLILGLSVIGLAFAFERLFALRRGILVPQALGTELRAALAARDPSRASSIVAASSGPLKRVLDAGLSRRGHGAREMERAMEAVGANEIARLKRPVRPLAILATVEPLLGLLGTVFGMISTFNMLHTTSAAERVERLAPGIGQALYTTAAGLCVAIPFLILFHWLTGKVNRAAEEWSLIGTDLALAFDDEPREQTGEAA